METQQPKQQDQTEKYTETLWIKAQWAGRKKSILQQEPPKYNHMELREDSSKIGASDVEYPRTCGRDGYQVRKFTSYSNGQSSAIYRKFEIDLPKDHEKVEEYKKTLKMVRKLPELEEKVQQIRSFKEMCEKAQLIREYQKVYVTVQTVWEKDSIAKYSRSTHARPFEINYRSHGWYQIPRMFNENLNNIIGEKLEEENLGLNSQTWGGFILQENDFNKAHNLLKPFYKQEKGGEK